MNDNARERGQAAYKKLFGEERESKSDDTALDNMTIEHLFADLWSRSNLQMRQRSMITVALLAASGRDRELERHIEGALHLGISREEVIEIMIHVAHYAGWPAGHNGLRIAQELFKSFDEIEASHEPIEVMAQRLNRKGGTKKSNERRRLAILECSTLNCLCVARDSLQYAV